MTVPAGIESRPLPEHRVRWVGHDGPSTVPALEPEFECMGDVDSACRTTEDGWCRVLQLLGSSAPYRAPWSTPEHSGFYLLDAPIEISFDEETGDWSWCYAEDLLVAECVEVNVAEAARVRADLYDAIATNEHALGLVFNWASYIVDAVIATGHVEIPAACRFCMAAVVDVRHPEVALEDARHVNCSGLHRPLPTVYGLAHALSAASGIALPPPADVAGLFELADQLVDEFPADTEEWTVGAVDSDAQTVRINGVLFRAPEGASAEDDLRLVRVPDADPGASDPLPE